MKQGTMRTWCNIPKLFLCSFRIPCLGNKQTKYTVKCIKCPLWECCHQSKSYFHHITKCIRHSVHWVLNRENGKESNLWCAHKFHYLGKQVWTWLSMLTSVPVYWRFCLSQAIAFQRPSHTIWPNLVKHSTKFVWLEGPFTSVHSPKYTQST